MPKTIVRNEEEHLYADQPRREAGRALSTALLRLRRAEHLTEIEELKRSGLSTVDLRTLRYIVQAARDGRNLSPKDVIVMLDTSSANVTNIIERLVRKSYVERASSPTDRRAVHLTPTPAAVDLVETAVGSHHALLVAAIDVLDDDEARITASVLERISRALGGASPEDGMA